jgi:hypothetical protein
MGQWFLQEVFAVKIHYVLGKEIKGIDFIGGKDVITYIKD